MSVAEITNRRPVLLGLAASAALTVLVVVGSRNLEHYDPALFGYTVASVVAFGALVYRYAVWLRRPATLVYWRRGWQLFRERRRLARNAGGAVATVARNLVEQRFIARRGFTRWLMHALIMWGCLISALITFPLVFGWVHFRLEGDAGYRAYIFGFPAPNVMPGRSLVASLMVIAGCAIAIRRRLNDRGAVALQQFMLDFVPHMLLISVSVTGLMLTASSLWLGGYMYYFIALTHQALVIMTLFYLPFGKFFHIVQRPASVGVELYQRREREAPQAVCPRCGTEFVGRMWLDDLKEVVDRLGFDYSMGDGRTLQDYCPRCKRVMRGLSYATLPRRDSEVFYGSRATEETAHRDGRDERDSQVQL
jgi:hypothetical protein